MKVSFIVVLLLAAMSVRAQNIVQTLNGAAGSSWDQPLWGSPANIPTAGNTYETPSGFDVRTTNNATAILPFLGNSLQIDPGAFLYLKNGTNVAVVNVVLDGGFIDFHGGFAPTPAALGGTVQVNTNSEIESDQTGANNANIWLLSDVSGTANLSVNMDDATHALILFGTNSAYSGNWTNITGIIEIPSGSSNALGSGSVTLNFSTSTFLIFNSTNNMVVSNAIYGIGNVIQMNTNTVTLAGTNAFTGYIQVNNRGVLQIGAGSSLTNASSIILSGAALDASQIGGLTLGTTQSVTCNGTGNSTVIGNVTVPGTNALNFNFSATTNRILNVTGTLTLNGNPNLNIMASGYITPGTYQLITYSGSLLGSGSFNLVPPAGSTETFQLSTSTPGQVNLVVVGAVYNLTWVGDGVNNNWDLVSTN